MADEYLDETYEYNAPKTYIDFTNFQDEDDCDDSFFDCHGEGRSKSLRNLALEEPKMSNEEKLDKDEEMETEETELNTEEEDETNKPVTRSSRKGPLGDDGIFKEPPARFSPRLVAIGKAVRSNSGGKSNSGFKRRRSISAGPAMSRKRIGGGSLTSHERKLISQMTSGLPDAGTNKPGSTNSLRSSRSLKGSTDSLAPKRTGSGRTLPREFKFATDARIKAPTAASSADPSMQTSASSFAKCLRSYAANNTDTSHCPKKKGPTKVQPFKLSQGRKASDTANEPVQQNQRKKFISLAELNMKFYCQTPDRFRSKPKNEPLTRKSSNNSINNAGLTQPQSPKFSTMTRSRPVHYLTREQEEEKQMQEAIQNKVKAKPLNPKIFEPPVLPSVPKKAVTAIEPFAITDLAKEVLQKDLDDSSFLDSLSDLDEELAKVPHTGVKAPTRKTNTKIQPFSFDVRDQERYKNKEEKIQQELKRQLELAEFHAHPMPVFDHGPKGLPPKKQRSATKPKPFELNIDKRGELRRQMIENEKLERERKEQDAREFHARPATVVQKQAFVPQPSSKPLTEITDFTLNTEKRSEDRHKFDMFMKQKEDKIQAEKRRLEELREQEELARIAEMRRTELVHKSRPMPKYPTPQPVSSDKPVTQPKSPNFATNTRLRSRNGSSSASLQSI